MIKSLLLGALGFYLLQNLVVTILLIKEEWKYRSRYTILYVLIMLGFGSFFAIIEWMGQELRGEN